MGSKELTRGAGVLLAITSLPSSYGIGTLGEAAFQFVDLLVDLKQRYWQVLPIGPTSFGNSPYQSYSAFAGNPYLIDLDDLVKDGLLQETEIRSFNWGTDDADIDYATIYENRYKILRMAFSRFSAKSEDFLAFTEKSDRWLSDYSLYTALKRHFGDIEWQSWDVPLRDRDPEAVKEYQEILHNDIMFCKFCQYEFFKQWMQLKQYANSRGVQIIGDMPLYVASDSVDVWAHREMFLLGPDGRPNVVAGAAPDAFSESSFSVHSTSLKPVSTVSPSTTSGRFTSIPSVARSFNCSSSPIPGNLSFNCMLLYKSPLVLKNFFNGSPLFSYHSFNSS